MWGLLRENSRLIEQFTSLAAAAGPLDNTDQLLQQVLVQFNPSHPPSLHILLQINLLNLAPLDSGHPTDL